MSVRSPILVAIAMVLCQCSEDSSPNPKNFDLADLTLVYEYKVNEGSNSCLRSIQSKRGFYIYEEEGNLKEIFKPDGHDMSFDWNNSFSDGTCPEMPGMLYMYSRITLPKNLDIGEQNI